MRLRSEPLDSSSVLQNLPSTECQAFFDAHRSNSERCVELQKLDEETQIAWENQAASSVSPGIVLSEEVLCRHWLNPIHWNFEKSELKPTAISDISRLGFSVNRLKHIDLAGIREKAEERVRDFNERSGDDVERFRSVIGFSNFKAEQVRRLFVAEPPRRAVAVYDTATTADPDRGIKEDKSHADVCQLITDKLQARRIRVDMWEIMTASFQRFEDAT